MIEPAHGSSSGSELKLKPAAHNGTANGKPEEGKDIISAGLRSHDHYKRALPRWRYHLRQRLLPLVRWETPYLAWFQARVRTTALDSYFAITANLGTHTFFMIGLPMLFWFNFMPFGRGLVHILASGVFFTGFLKDMCSLPRPLSPPLQRITMSGSAALEYGFPSTHSANAVSVAVYAVLSLHDPSNDMPATIKLFLEVLAYFYALSIVVGRLYCGMHGFADVIVGSSMGAAISYIEFFYGPRLEAWLYNSSWVAPLTIVLFILVFVRIHPEPADDCPCFDDSVAFAGVVLGLEMGCWRYMRSSSAWPKTASFGPSVIGWPAVIARLVFGVMVIFVWRAVMKPVLLKTLPYLFRVMEAVGLSLPRRFFTPASEYHHIPEAYNLRTDNVIPHVTDLPDMVRNMRSVGRGRSISIGPQSAADAYETLAYRERRRRESLEGMRVRNVLSSYDLKEKSQKESSARNSAITTSRSSNGVAGVPNPTISLTPAADVQDEKGIQTSGAQPGGGGGSLAEYEAMMGQGRVMPIPSPAASDIDPLTTWPPLPSYASSAPTSDSAAQGQQEVEKFPELYVGQADELNEREMFDQLVKPRVRYDVEVVTKLIVYAGIAWLAVDIIPVMLGLLTPILGW